MKKKPEIVENIEDVETVVETPKIVERKKIEKITFNFGRDDLNMLRDKLNEVIENL